MSTPEYCSECSWLTDKMGACLPPGKAAILSYISYIPYLIIIAFIILTLFSRHQRQLKMSLLLISGYVIGDRILKNLIQSPRPEGSCKKSFGLPSSHMTVICLYSMELWMRSKKSQKLFLIFLVVSQGIARVQLLYHTTTQVIAGVMFSIVYVMLFHLIWKKIEGSQKFQKILSILEFKTQKKQEQGKKKKE